MSKPLLVFVILTALACSVPNFAMDLTPTPTQTTRGASPTPIALVTREPNRTPIPPPQWWPPDLALPHHATLTSHAKRIASWQTQETNVEGLAALLAKQGTNAGYQSFTLLRSRDAIYDLLFLKGTNVYALNLTRGSNATTLTANLGALIRLKVAGAYQFEVDLPVRDPIVTAAGNEVFIATEIPSPQCPRCKYVVWIHIAPFRGLGTYTSKPAGVYLIDVLIVPGGDPLKEDYRWASDCTVAFRDTSTGTFQCVGLTNIHEDRKRIDISGSWIQPPPP